MHAPKLRCHVRRGGMTKKGGLLQYRTFSSLEPGVLTNLHYVYPNLEVFHKVENSDQTMHGPKVQHTNAGCSGLHAWSTLSIHGPER